MRKIVIDTETTGISVEKGHRIIEIGCVEIINRKITGKEFSTYINPMRKIDSGAILVHGLTNNFLKNKPIFSEIVDDLINFIGKSEIIAHNASFDCNFINYEFSLLKKKISPINKLCNVIDSLKIARKLYPGKKNSLEFLCKRFGIKEKRDLHGALLDAKILAKIYLKMTAYQKKIFSKKSIINDKYNLKILRKNKKRNLKVIYSSKKEVSDHNKYMKFLKNE